MTTIRLSRDLAEPIQSDGSPLPMLLQKAVVVADYAKGEPVRAKLEGILKSPRDWPVVDVEADMIVTGRDGRRYRLVPEDEA